MIGASPIAARPIGALPFVAQVALVLDASSGSYALTGNIASLITDKTITLNSSSYTITGYGSNLSKTFNLQAASATYLITGSDVTFLTTKTLVASNGTYSLTGSAAIVGRQITLRANSGSYNISLPVQSQTYVLKWYTGSAWQILYKDPIVYP